MSISRASREKSIFSILTALTDEMLITTQESCAIIRQSPTKPMSVLVTQSLYSRAVEKQDVDSSIVPRSICNVT